MPHPSKSGTFLVATPAPVDIRNGSDLCVELRNRPTRLAACYRDFSIGMCGVTAERKNSSGEVLFEHRVGRCLNGVSATALGKKQHAVQNLRLRNCRREQTRGRLCRHPIRDRDASGAGLINSDRTLVSRTITSSAAVVRASVRAPVFPDQRRPAPRNDRVPL